MYCSQLWRLENSRSRYQKFVVVARSLQMVPSSYALSLIGQDTFSSLLVRPLIPCIRDGLSDTPDLTVSQGCYFLMLPLWRLCFNTQILGRYKYSDSNSFKDHDFSAKGILIAAESKWIVTLPSLNVGSTQCGSSQH